MNIEKNEKDYIIALYMRVSLEDREVRTENKEESDSIANQRELLLDFIGRRQEFIGCKVVEWCDDGYSGTNFRRPALTELLQEVEKGRVNCLVVKDFSRFGRDYLTVSDYVEQIFPFLRVRFISVNDNYDSDRDAGTARGLEMAFYNIAYGWYSRDISEKEKSGRRVKAQNGDFLSAFAPIGYRKDEKNKNRLVAEERGAEIVRRIFRLAGSGRTVKEIARLFNGEGVPTPSALKQKQGYTHPWWKGIHGESLWDVSSITRILRDERYLGKAVYGKRGRMEVGNYKGEKRKKDNWIVVPDCHEPLVTKEEFQAAQNMLRKCGKIRKGRKGRGIFRGKLRCGVCGYALVRKGKGRGKYCCVTKERAVGFSCTEYAVDEEELADVVKSVVGLYRGVFGGEMRKKGTAEGKEEKRRDTKAEKKERYDMWIEGMKAYNQACEGFAKKRARLYERMVDEGWEREKYIEKRELLLKEERRLQTEKEKWVKDGKLKREKWTTEKEVCENQPSYEMVDALIDNIFVYEQAVIQIQWKFGLNK